MAKFNKPTKKSTQTTNYEGDEAYTLTPELELYTAVVTTSLGRKFYEGDEERIARIRELVKKVNPEFVAKLAVYTREQMYLRSVPLALTVELAKVHSGDSLVGRLVARVIQRADEITELLAYYAQANEREETKKLGKLSKQIQRGLSVAFNKFNEYQFGKYNRKTEVCFKDALFLTHPRAKDKDQQKLFNKITNDTLEVPYTWEVELSELGKKEYKTEEEKQKAFGKKWEELIDSDKLGYMALLRNLRNIIQAEVSQKHLQKIAKRLSDKKEVEKSKQLPFRFLAAYRELKDEVSTKSSMILDALEEAIQASAQNIKGYDYGISVLVACDVSGSMQCTISERSKIQNYDIGLMLGMLLQSKCKSVISGIFGDDWKVINLPKNNILSNADELHNREGEVGYSTNGYKVVQDLTKRNLVVDKVMIFTDCQLWDSEYGDTNIRECWNEYKKIAPDAKLYIFDLAGYGDTPLDVRSGGVHLIAGWSDKVFDVLDAIENGSTAVKEIEKVVL